MGDVDIKKRLIAQIEKQGATPADLDQKGVHLLAADDGRLSVLLKEGVEGVDKLEGSIETKAGSRAVEIVSTGEKLDLDDELGKWTIYDIKNIDAKTPIGPSDAPSVLHVYSSAAQGREAGSAFYASIDLGYAIGKVLEKDDIVVRGLPMGPGFAPVDPLLARYIADKLGPKVAVDDRATAEVVKPLIASFLAERSRVIDTGLIGVALALDLFPEGPALPRVNMYTGSRDETGPERKEGELSAPVRDYLDERDLLPVGRFTAKWAEETIRSLGGDGGAEHVILELRRLRLELKKKNVTASASLWDDEDGGAKKTTSKAAEPAELPALNDGKFNKAYALRLKQLELALDGLGVPRETIQKVARETVMATINPRETGLIILAGELYSAADYAQDLMLKAIGGPRVLVTDADIADKGAPGVYGLTPRGDGVLAGAEMKRALDRSMGHKIAVVFSKFDAAGMGQPDDESQVQARGMLLKNLAEVARTGTANVFSLKEQGMKPVSMRGTVLVVRDQREPAVVEAELDLDPELRALKAKLIGFERPSAESGIARLGKDLADAIRSMGFANAKIELAPDLERALTREVEELARGDAPSYAAAMQRIRRDLAAALSEEASMKEGAKTFVLDFSEMLIDDEERAAALQGGVVRGAYESFTATAR